MTVIEHLAAARHRALLMIWRRRIGAHRLAALGRDSVIVPPATILAPHRIVIGDRVLVFERATFSLVEEYNGRRYSPHLRIGDRTVICHTAWFSCVGEVEIGDDVLIGHNVLIADSFHEYADRSRPISAQPMATPRSVRIGAGSVIGPGAAILSGTTLGAGTYVAAGAVVAGEYAAHSVLAGNPAEVIRSWDEAQNRFLDSADPRFVQILRSLGGG